jgi:hypothetical protein
MLAAPLKAWKRPARHASREREILPRHEVISIRHDRLGRPAVKIRDSGGMVISAELAQTAFWPLVESRYMNGRSLQ